MQEEILHTLGAKLNYFDPRDIPVSGGIVSLPDVSQIKSFRYDYIDSIPVNSQKSLGSCVSQAESQCKAIQDFEESRLAGKTNFELLSAQHLASLIEVIEGNNGQGAQPRNAGKVLSQNGIATEKIYTTNNNLTWAEFIKLKSSADITNSANKHKIQSYGFCANDLEIFLATIYLKKAVGITLPVTANAGWETGILTAPNMNNITGLHRIYAFGFERLANGDIIIECRNSWGENWGTLKGNLKFKWSDYQNYIWDIMTYIDAPYIPENNNLKYQWNYNLGMGSKNKDVSALQIALKTKNLFYNKIIGDTQITDCFDAVTKMSLIRYQTLNKIPATGFCGVLTRAQLNKDFK